jgi:hypothetical protein
MCCSMCVRPARPKWERERQRGKEQKNEHCVAYKRRRTSREKQKEREKERKRIDQKMTRRVGSSVDMRMVMG